MHKFILFIGLIFSNASFSAGVVKWELIGPGDADQVTSLSVLDDGSVFAGTDVGGIYVSANHGDTWKDRNSGLDNYDITTPVIQDLKNSDILYVGTRGGFYKSLDYGETWDNKRTGLPKIKKYGLSGSIGSIATNPENPENIILGLGYRPSGDGTKTVRNLKWPMVVYESFDRGESWKAVTAFSTPTKVYQLQFSNTVTGLIFAATNTGIYSGKTDGKLWRKLLNKHCYNFLDFKDKPEYFVSACGNDGVYITADSGDQWQLSNDGLGFNIFSKNQRYSVLAADDKAPDTIYLANSVWNPSGGLYKSSDRGRRWQRITNKMPESWLSTSKKMNAVAVDPNNSSLVYLGSSRYLYKSMNAGANWHQLISKSVGGKWMHRGINVFGHTRDIVVDSMNENRIFMATADHGLILSEDAGISWESVSEGVPNSNHVWDVEQCRSDPEVFYWVSSSLKGKSCLYKNNKNSTGWVSMCQSWPGKTSAQLVLTDPSDCKTVYVATDNNILATSNGGRAWEIIGAGLGEGRVFSLASSADGKVLYAGKKNGLFYSRDKGKTWWELRAYKNKKVVSILISRTDAEILLVGTEFGKGKIGGLFISYDGGKSIKNVLTIRKLVSGIVQHPDKPDIFFASTNDHNYHDLSSGSGIYYSIDGGESWTVINNELSVKRAWNISISAASNRVYLSANGSGGYYLDLREFDLSIK